MEARNPRYVQRFGPVVATDLDSVLAACDDRLAALYGGRTWLAFSGGQPAHQIPPWGAIYVLTADNKRTRIPGPNTPDDGFNWPFQYRHEDHLAAAAALNTVGYDPVLGAWLVEGTYALSGYTMGDCAAVLERDAVWEGNSGLKPIRLVGSPQDVPLEAERFQRYALADVIIDDDDVAEVGWPHDKHGVIRIHNVGRTSKTVTLGSGQSLLLPPWGIRTLRRLARGGAWDLVEERHYFPRAYPGDVPMWDTMVSSMPSFTLRGQTANPIFRQAVIASLFRPQPLLDSPGMFSSTVADLMPEVVSSDTLGNVLGHDGQIEVIRSNAATPLVVHRSLITFAGTVVPTPADWIEAGLETEINPAGRSFLIYPRSGFAPPEEGEWKWDLFSRTTNLTGGVLLDVSESRQLGPFFATDDEYDGWFLEMFGVQDIVSETDGYSVVQELRGTWVPRPGSADPDWDGHYDVLPSVEHRSYRGRYVRQGYSMQPWNLWLDHVSDHLPQGDHVRQARVVRSTVCTALLFMEGFDFFHARTDPDWDDACAVDFLDGPHGLTRQFHAGGQPLGLGSLGEDGRWWEPRLRTSLLPTIGWNAWRDWSALGASGDAEILWTPLIPSEFGEETKYHFRVQLAAGAPQGMNWTWSYGDDYPGPPTHPRAVLSVEPSGIAFWRVFMVNFRHTMFGVDLGKPLLGPQPWRLQDHAWLADQVLENGPALGPAEWHPGFTWPWSEARAFLHDAHPLGYGDITHVMGPEYHLGFQIPMTARTANQIVGLVSGITHCRPLGWEHFVDGFAYADLYTGLGWIQGTNDVSVTPYGAVHIYAHDINGPDSGSSGVGNPSVDAKLDALGIPRRRMECPELVVRRGTLLTLWDLDGLYYWRPYAPAAWAQMGFELEYITMEDLATAIESRGFSCEHAIFVHRVSLLDPTGNLPGFSVKLIDEIEIHPELPTNGDPVGQGQIGAVFAYSNMRLRTTELITVDDPAGDYQIVRADAFHVYLQREPPFRRQAFRKATYSGGGAPPPPPPPPEEGWPPAPAPIPIIWVSPDGWEFSVVAFVVNSGAAIYSLTFHAEADPRFLSATLLAAPGREHVVHGHPIRGLMLDHNPSAVPPDLLALYPFNVPVRIPAAVPPKWIMLQHGDRVAATSLGGAAWPNGHHLWRLSIMPDPPRQFTPPAGP